MCFIVEVIKLEWEKLKDNYRKCLNKREKATRSGAGTKKLPTCNFFIGLSFLRDTLVNRKTESNLPSPSSNDLSLSVDDYIEYPCDLTSPVDEPAATTSTPSQSYDSPFKKQTYENRKTKKANDLQLGIDALLVKALSKDLDNSSSEQAPKQSLRENDGPDVLFCLSLVDTLKKLDARKNAMAKMKIQQLLFEIEFDG